MKLQTIRWEPGPEVKRGRKPIGLRAMTRAELTARHRAKKKAALPPKPEKRKKLGTEFQSLSDHLGSPESPVRRYIDSEFPHLQEISKKINLSLGHFKKDAHQSYPKNILYMLAGTAMDYRIRMYFSDSPHKFSALATGLAVIKRATLRDDTTKITNPWNTMFRRNGYVGISDKLILSFERFVKKTNPMRRLLSPRDEEKLCRYCILFGLVDFFRRGSPGAFERLIEIGSMDISAMLRKMDKVIVKDLMKLSVGFYRKNKTLLKNFSVARIGETLPGSKDVGGADFDIIVDGCLFEIKTTIKPKISTSNLRQLIGYFLLDYTDEFKMRTAAIHLTRQGHTESFDIKRDLLRTKKSIKAIRESFRQLKFQP